MGKAIATNIDKCKRQIQLFRNLVLAGIILSSPQIFQRWRAEEELDVEAGTVPRDQTGVGA